MKTYAVFAVVFVLLVKASGLQHGEVCQTPNRARGTCIGVRECPPLVKALKANPIPQSTLDFLRRSQCGYQGNAPLACCPSTSTVSSPTTPKPIAATTNKEVTEDVSRHRNLGLLRPKLCGPIFDDKIINGNRTKLNEMPWMALLSYTVTSGSPFRCGGSIINERYILTAAHCVKNLPKGFRPTSVRLGEHDLNSATDCQEDPDGEPGDRLCAAAPQDIRIEEIVAHPNYKGKPSLQNDIALIRLSRPVDFSSDSRRPACLPVGLQQQTHKLNGVKVTVAGWGITEKGTTSPVLLKVTIPVMPHDQCANAYRRTEPISAVSQVCAGGIKKGGDSCTGDSGGPLTYFGDVQGSPRTIQYGLVSFGPRNCGSFGQPGVYTRVGHFMKWILDNLKP